MLRALRTEYGVTDAITGHGGNHPWVEFNHAGRRHRLAVSNAGGDKVAAVNWTRQALRARLGKPIEKETKMSYKAVEEATHLADRQLNILKDVAIKKANEQRLEKTTSPSACTVALYTYHAPDKCRLRFNIPSSLGLDRWTGVAIKTLGQDAWELWEDPSIKRRWHTGERDGTVKLDVTVTAEDLFGSSPAEAVIVDNDRLLITCPVATRITLGRRTVDDNAPQVCRSSMRDRMLSVLREIAAIEAETERRLSYEKDVWQWTALPIRLEK
jgi:hypothetical protein